MVDTSGGTVVDATGGVSWEGGTDIDRGGGGEGVLQSSLSVGMLIHG